ncbi:MAG: hypothetical protein IJ662_03215 [Clostridia bacterium]|nr:hypothetical protein [Clostridia bacterium]
MAGRNSSARTVAFCGMTAALSAVIMLLGGVIPIATYAVPMLCGLLILPILLEFGARPAWATFAAVGLLSLMLGFDKEAAFFYLLIIGYYPIVKWRIDKAFSPVRRLLVKLFLFAAAFALMYALLALLFPVEAALQEFAEMGSALTVAFAAVYLLSMLLYDRLLTPFAMLYWNRVRPKLRFLIGR